MTDAGPSPAHELGALAGGLACLVDELSRRLHTLHATPAQPWRECQVSSACISARQLVGEAERLAGAPVDADDFTDQAALYAEAVALLGGPNP